MAWVNPWLMVFRHLPRVPLYSVVVNIMKFYRHDRNSTDVNVSSSETSGQLTSAICSQPCLVSGDSPEPASTSYISELNHDYQYLSRVNDDAKINSIPGLKEYLATNVKDEHLYYKRSLVFDREEEIYNAMEQFEDEFFAISVFLRRKFPELDKFVNKCGDIITTKSLLVLCDYLENVNGVKPHLKLSQRYPVLQLDVSFEDDVGDDSDASDIEFEGEILRDLGRPLEKVKQLENEVFDFASHIERVKRVSSLKWLYPVTEDVHVVEGGQILDCEIVGEWDILADRNMLITLQNHGFIQQKFMVQI